MIMPRPLELVLGTVGKSLNAAITFVVPRSGEKECNIVIIIES